jgi:hypothetical protein
MQTKKESLIEACVNTGVGFFTTLLFSYPIYYYFGVKINAGQMAGVTILFTFISIVRSYIIRRWFNNLEGIKRRLKRIFIKQIKL